MDSNINSNNIKQIKLVSGDLIITNIVYTDEKEIMIEYPQEMVEIESRIDIEDDDLEIENLYQVNTTMQMMDWMIGAKEQVTIIKQDHVIFITDIQDELKKIFVEKYLSICLMEKLKKEKPELFENCAFENNEDEIEDVDSEFEDDFQKIDPEKMEKLRFWRNSISS